MSFQSVAIQPLLRSVRLFSCIEQESNRRNSEDHMQKGLRLADNISADLGPF